MCSNDLRNWLMMPLCAHYIVKLCVFQLNETDILVRFFFSIGLWTFKAPIIKQIVQCEIFVIILYRLKFFIMFHIESAVRL